MIDLTKNEKKCEKYLDELREKLEKIFFEFDFENIETSANNLFSSWLNEITLFKTTDYSSKFDQLIKYETNKLKNIYNEDFSKQVGDLFKTSDLCYRLINLK